MWAKIRRHEDVTDRWLNGSWALKMQDQVNVAEADGDAQEALPRGFLCA